MNIEFKDAVNPMTGDCVGSAVVKNGRTVRLTIEDPEYIEWLVDLEYFYIREGGGDD